MSSRPELQGLPEAYYNEKEAAKYHSNSRIITIQREITNRAIELLNLSDEQKSMGVMLLDIGCGSGLSGEAIEEYAAQGSMIDRSFEEGDKDEEDEDEEEYNEEDTDMIEDLQKNSSSKQKTFFRNTKKRTENLDIINWIGVDISPAMLDIANDRDTENGNLAVSDMGQGLPFRPGIFDGVISISALQWLCYVDEQKTEPKVRLMRFFSSLYWVMKREARAVLQFYPERPEHLYWITESATRVGFKGGLVVDYPNSSKAKKYYLCLSFDTGYKVPKAIDCQHNTISNNNNHQQNQVMVQSSKADKIFHKSKGRKGKKQKGKTKEWVLAKKERQRRQGKHVRADSKYTARKRKDKF